MLGIAVAGGVIAFAQLNRATTENELAKADIQQMNERIDALKGRAQLVQQQLTPEQQSVLIASHRLIANKTFGWSRLFADLESVMPGSVSASRIAVENVYKDGDRIKAELEFGVLSRDYGAVQEMIGRMQNSGLFQPQLRGQDRQENDRGTFTEYTLHLVYLPAYGYSAAQQNDIAQGGEPTQ